MGNHLLINMMQLIYTCIILKITVRYFSLACSRAEIEKHKIINIQVPLRNCRWAHSTSINIRSSLNKCSLGLLFVRIQNATHFTTSHCGYVVSCFPQEGQVENINCPWIWNTSVSDCSLFVFVTKRVASIPDFYHSLYSGTNSNLSEQEGETNKLFFYENWVTVQYLAAH